MDYYLKEVSSMFGMGIQEIIVILIIAFIIFGPRRLPELGRNLGHALNNFKKASEEIPGSKSSCRKQGLEDLKG